MKTEDELRRMIFDRICLLGIDIMEIPFRDTFSFGPSEDDDTNDELEWNALYKVWRHTTVQTDYDTLTMKIEFDHDPEVAELIETSIAIEDEMTKRFKESYERNHSPMPEAG
jgi:hypothetical protein